MLSEGARIAIIAPSGIFNPERLATSVKIVHQWGYETVEAPNLHARHHYTAGTAQQRREDLRWALTHDEVDAVWFARGGYGTVHLLDDLPWSELDGRPVIGFSDATALFVAMDRVGVGDAVHGPVLHSLADHVDDNSRDALHRLLRLGTETHLTGEHLCGPRQSVVGRVIGGNLCVCASLAGGPWSLRGAGAILLLEDINEPPYKIDRLITQLKHSGAFDGVVGVALGEFTNCHAPKGADWTMEDVFIDLLSPLNVPVVMGLPVGHGARNVAWRYGSNGVLTQEGLFVG